MFSIFISECRKPNLWTLDNALISLKKSSFRFSIPSNGLVLKKSKRSIFNFSNNKYILKLSSKANPTILTDLVSGID